MKQYMRILREHFRLAARIQWAWAVTQPETMIEAFLEHERTVVVRALAHILKEEADHLILEDLLAKEMKQKLERQKFADDCDYEYLGKLAEEIELPKWFVLRMDAARREQFTQASRVILKLRKEELEARIDEYTRQPYVPSPETVRQAVATAMSTLERHVKN